MGFFNRKKKDESALNGTDAAKNEMLETAVSPEKRYEFDTEYSSKLVKVLSSEYSSVYYVDLITGEMSIISLSDTVFNNIGSFLRQKINFSFALKLVLAKQIRNSDREELKKFASAEFLKDLMRNRKTYTRVYRDGTEKDYVYYEMKIVKVDPLESEATAIVLGIADKDAEVRAELALKAQQRKDEDIINILSSDYASMFYVDAASEYLETRFVDKYTDNRFTKMLEGVSNYSEALRLYVSRCVVESDCEMVLSEAGIDNIRAQLSKKKRYTFTYLSNKNGGQRYCEMKFVKVDPDDEPVTAFVLGVVDRDDIIRHEKEREAELAEAKRDAEAASEAKTSFLFNMSHDIRTPMNAIIGFANIAEKHIDDKEKVIDSLDKLKVASDHLLNLINEVLDMARIESGKTVIEEEEVNIVERVQNIRNIISQTAKDKKIDFTLTVNQLHDENVFADVLHLNQVLINIIGNAIKYTKEGGKVSLTLEQVACEKDGCGSYVFSVQDNGIGMSKEYVEHIFEEFTREKSSTVSGIQGTGLGMAITKRLTDMLGGDIKVTSELGKGTLVVLRFDFKIKENIVDKLQQNVGKESADPSILDGKRMLLVEDNEMNREIAKDILEDYGMIVEEAFDGVIAVETLKEKGPDYYDMVFMDVQMPRMDGYEATRVIRALPDEGFKKLLIIAMTANAFEEDRRAAIDAGMNAHLAKPINIRDLLSTIVDFLD